MFGGQLIEIVDRMTQDKRRRRNEAGITWNDSPDVFILTSLQFIHSERVDITLRRTLTRSRVEIPSKH